MNSKTEDEREHKERAAIFDIFLNACLKNELFTPKLAEFLAPLKEIPIFGQVIICLSASNALMVLIFQEKNFSQ